MSSQPIGADRARWEAGRSGSARAGRRVRPWASATPLLAALLLAAGTGSAGPLLGQSGGEGAAPRSDATSAGEPELSLLPDVPFSTMHILLEKTIFNVDVLTLDVRVDATTASEIEEAFPEAEVPDDETESAVARAALEAGELVGRIEFQRGVSLGQFLDAVDDDMRKAVDVGWLEPAAYRKVRDGLPGWFSFVGERGGIRDGERLSYHVRGDTLRTVFATREGEILLDQTDIGRQNVVALVGAWFAPGSSFREELVESLFDRYVRDRS